ncbi:predicted ORF [Xanthomonas phage XacN1]|nr:predicted ORF [Xanthomonas phage XacN1]BBA65629.1 predicted ORF [Xanthomonas phage XacN1]
MPFQPANPIESGRAIALLLASVTIIVNGATLVESVGYSDATDQIIFYVGEDNDSIIIFPRENFAVADWDEDHNDDSFYIVLDVEDIHHTMKLYRNDSLEIMRQLKEKL